MLPLNKRFFCVAASVVSLVVVALQGQQTQPPAAPPIAQDDTGTIFRSDTRLVVLHTTVMDKSGHLITDLPREAFTVFENGAPQPIKSFKREDVPVSMGLIIEQRRRSVRGEFQ